MHFIRGPVGQLESLVHDPKKKDPFGVAVVCHPHPLFGGTMNNKVVTTLVKVFNELGAIAIRFNFRGVGKSEGIYDNAVGEIEDLLAVVQWVRKYYLNQPLFLGGFSFGAYVAACVAVKVALRQLVLIAPPVHHFNFLDLPEFECPWIVAQGEQDELAPPEQVFEWIKSRRNTPKLIKIPNVGHFFHGHLVELKNRLLAQLGVMRPG